MIIIGLIFILVVLFGLFCLGIFIGICIEEKEHYIKLSKIKIRESFKKHPPAIWKMRDRISYYKIYGRLYSPIIINERGYLIDGYTSYLIAQNEGLKKVEIYRN